MRKENRNLRKIPTSQLVKYKYYKKILHIPQCWYHHQSHVRFRQADNKSTAAYTVEEASKVFFTTTVQGSCWVLSTATFCPVQILLIWTVGQRSRFVDSERLLTATFAESNRAPFLHINPLMPGDLFSNFFTKIGEEVHCMNRNRNLKVQSWHSIFDHARGQKKNVL